MEPRDFGPGRDRRWSAGREEIGSGAKRLAGLAASASLPGPHTTVFRAPYDSGGSTS